MLKDLLNIGVGAVLGSVITRQYDEFKVRVADAVLLRLAYEEIGDYEGVLLCIPPEAQRPSGRLGEQIPEITKASNENIRAFLRSQLSLLLPGEVRSELKAIAGAIDLFNASLKSGSVGDFFGSERFLETAQSLALKSVQYTTTWRYRFLGLHPKWECIMEGLTEEERHKLTSRLGLL